MKKVFLTMAIVLAVYSTYAQTNTFSSSGDAVLGLQGYIGNALQFSGWGEVSFMRSESIGNSGNGHTRLRVYLTDDWTYDQGFEIIAKRYDGPQRSLLYIPGDGSQTDFFSGASFGANVGIGTTTPNAKLDVNGIIQTYNKDNNGATWDNMRMWSDGVSSHIESNGDEGGLYLKSNIAGKILLMSNVGIGTTTPDAQLAVKGTIHAQEVKVDMTGWNDFVFDKNYLLPTLSSVKTYIDQNHHLPEMPAEAEVIKNGVNLGEMVKLQTKKIEELTLYLIEKDKQVIDQQKQISNQNKLLAQQNKAIQLLQQQINQLAKKIKS
jgi:hypothetical protein